MARRRKVVPGNKFTLRLYAGFYLILISAFWAMGCQSSSASESEKDNVVSSIEPDSPEIKDTVLDVLDTVLYDRLWARLVNDQDSSFRTPKTVYPLPGAILPFHRVVAFYGNLYSKRMGILGALPADQMLDSLRREVKRWQLADTTTIVKPALHYIAVTAQKDPGKGQKYRQRMPSKEIDKVLKIAAEIDAIVFLDIQIGHSTLEEEIPLLKDYLRMPNVHLGIDPEYAMQGESVPGKRVGTFDAAAINYASDYLEELVKTHNLPPKILVVHRFKKSMVTNYKLIQLKPEVQIVMHMDGFGSRGKKLTTYANTITAEPVQFTGFKLFYKNDIADPSWISIMQPAEILKLNPVPVYIQYQ